ncbi:DUF1501 domain-containing protein [bacterium]|nr:DUF1501 domain-containing protein [bacterium]
MNPFSNTSPFASRRDFLSRSGMGFGAMALADLLAKDALAAQGTQHKALKFPVKAKSVIFLFMEGGPSHLDLFDRKPLLNQLAGKPIPPSFGKVITAMGEEESPLLACPREWKRYGQCGHEVSNWMPNVGEMADELCVIRSCAQDGINHSAGVCQMNTGHVVGGRPSLGAWVNYGLGTENHDMPAFVVLTDSTKQVVNGPRNWGSGFMPAKYQGVALKAGDEPIKNLNTPVEIGEARQVRKLSFLNRVNERHAGPRGSQSELDARMASYELAFRMQAAAPGIIDIEKESQGIKDLYGLEQKETAVFGKNCLMARRLVESGVRFVQLYSGAGSGWDSHSKMEQNHGRLCKAVDQPIAALLKDLKQRGLLDETLVIWGGEFGRTPMSEKGDGRDHNPTGFTMWMAGGGVKGGQVIGATDDLGLHAVEDRLHVHDLHASIMRILGVDHTQLIYPHKGRPERIDLNEGEAFMRLMG